MTTSPNVMIYAAMDGWRRQMVRDGQRLLGAALDLSRHVRRRIDTLPGLHVLEDELLGVEASHDLDGLQVLISVRELGISGYQAADWLRAHCRIDVGLSDSERILATLSMADDASTTDRLCAALEDLVRAAPSMERAAPVQMPSPHDLELESVDNPRDAFFGKVETVPVEQAAGRIAAEQVTPYPPGIPVLVPGERITAAVLDYLRTGLAAGMVLPDPADKTLETIRVTTRGVEQP